MPRFGRRRRSAPGRPAVKAHFPPSWPVTIYRRPLIGRHRASSTERPPERRLNNHGDGSLRLPATEREL